MAPDSRTSTVRKRDRLNLPLAGQTFDAIDSARLTRPGDVSRNTWITKSIEEKPAPSYTFDDLGKAAGRDA
jgi:hypothetical protein